MNKKKKNKKKNKKNKQNDQTAKENINVIFPIMSYS